MLKKALESLSKHQRADRFSEQLNYLSNFIQPNNLNIIHPNKTNDPIDAATQLNNLNIKKIERGEPTDIKPTTSPSKLVPESTTTSHSVSLATPTKVC